MKDAYSLSGHEPKTFFTRAIKFASRMYNKVYKKSIFLMLVSWFFVTSSSHMKNSLFKFICIMIWWRWHDMNIIKNQRCIVCPKNKLFSKNLAKKIAKNMDKKMAWISQPSVKRDQQKHFHGIRSWYKNSFNIAI